VILPEEELILAFAFKWVSRINFINISVIISACHFAADDIARKSREAKDVSATPSFSSFPSLLSRAEKNFSVPYLTNGGALNGAIVRVSCGIIIFYFGMPERGEQLRRKISINKGIHSKWNYEIK